MINLAVGNKSDYSPKRWCTAIEWLVILKYCDSIRAHSTYRPPTYPFVTLHNAGPYTCNVGPYTSPPPSYLNDPLLARSTFESLITCHGTVLQRNRSYTYHRPTVDINIIQQQSTRWTSWSKLSTPSSRIPYLDEEWMKTPFGWKTNEDHIWMKTEWKLYLDERWMKTTFGWKMNKDHHSYLYERWMKTIFGWKMNEDHNYFDERWMKTIIIWMKD